MDPRLLSMIIPLAVVLLFASFQIVLLLRRLISANRSSRRVLDQGNMRVPSGGSVRFNTSSQLVRDLLRDWSSGELPPWGEQGKVKAPRVVLAKLETGSDLEEVNSYLRRALPWGNPGSKWLLNPRGDYDFTLLVLTTILFLYGDDEKKLHPETRDHILEKLLTVRGRHPRRTAPRSLGLVVETENHLLMTEGSRYLRAKWLSDHFGGNPEYTRDHEVLERKLLRMLGTLNECGLYEFNSDPYSAYSVTALLNLEAFGSIDVSGSARFLLDRLFYQFALGSSKLRRLAPFRRQISRAGDHRLDRDLMSAFTRVYVSLYPGTKDRPEVGPHSEHSLMASVLPYRPPNDVMDLVLGDGRELYVRIGHGCLSSPEIISRGPGFVLSAGGVHRGIASRLVSRPITLLLDDDAINIRDVLHLQGPGENFRGWNNTGVHHRFAVAAGPVHVPERWEPVSRSSVWGVYRRRNVTIGVHSSERLGIIVILTGSPEGAQLALDRLNHDERKLEHTFDLPDGKRIGYDVTAPRNRWVITSVGGQNVDRRFDGWPLIDGDIIR
ncbi:MAG: hypothetical protein JW939_04500 [Candidatus Thermoplasmatota archaeon]|nr:hypothetical protein [Candidatus Thermoplasmatota archaeon]